MLKDFISLPFPYLCVGCQNTLNTDKELICFDCLTNLPVTNFSFDDKNKVAQKFWGKVPVHKSIAYLNFNKEGLAQHMIHALKYSENRKIGDHLGFLLGKEILKQEPLSNIDIVIPVPLHKRRLRKRGYNQSDVIAVGVSRALNVEYDNKSLLRTTNNDSQTKKNLFQRWKNVETLFELKKSTHLRGKHILLVDDVITTGATLEACISELNQVKNIKVSVGTLAITV